MHDSYFLNIFSFYRLEYLRQTWQKNKCKIGIYGQSQYKSHRDRESSPSRVCYGFRCLKRKFASVLENTYAFKIASVGLTEASAPV